MHVSLYCIYVSNTPSICYDMHVSMYCIHVSLSSMTCMSVCTACMSLTSLMIYVCQPGYGSTANDNFNQRAKVYCYLKATYPGGDFTAEGRQDLGVLGMSVMHTPSIYYDMHVSMYCIHVSHAHPPLIYYDMQAGPGCAQEAVKSVGFCKWGGGGGCHGRGAGTEKGEACALGRQGGGTSQTRRRRTLTHMSILLSWVSVPRLREKPDHVFDMGVCVSVMSVSVPT